MTSYTKEERQQEVNTLKEDLLRLNQAATDVLEQLETVERMGITVTLNQTRMEELLSDSVECVRIVEAEFTEELEV